MHRSCHSKRRERNDVITDIFYSQLYFSALANVFPKSFTRAFSSYSHLDVCDVEAKSVRVQVNEIFWDEAFMVRNTVKLDSFDVRPLLLENEATFP